MMFKRSAVISVLLLVAAISYFLAPPHRQNFITAVDWWQQWLAATDNNLFPDRRGLNIAVLTPEGNFVEARQFDTSADSDTGFADYTGSLSPQNWVVVAAQNDAADSLGAEDLTALAALGGSGALVGKYRWAYVLVGRPRLGLGKGLEQLDDKQVTVGLEAGKIIGGQPLPVQLAITSAGLSAGSYVRLQVGKPDNQFLLQWLITAWKRME